MNANHLRSLIGKLDSLCRASLEGAIGLCVSRTHHNVDLEHVLVRLLEAPDSDLARIFRHFLVDSSKLTRDLGRALDRFQGGSSRPPVFSRRVLQLIREAWIVASVDFTANQVRSSHLLLALLQNDDFASLIRDSSAEWQKISLETLNTKLVQITANSPEDIEQTRASASPGEGAASQSDDSALGKYTIDLTDRARKGAIDEVVGRDSEIRKMIGVLLRRRQNNPILVGEAGVGKTAVVEGLALRVARGQVPRLLKDVSLRVLDLGLLQAGAGVRGEFENRLKTVIQEVKDAPRPVILFIDEAHTLIGAGGQAGQGDAANLLKPALARGELRTIAATTWSEYKQHIEDDPALARRFQAVKIEEPSEAQAEVMLRGLVSGFESHHKTRILPEAVRAAVRLSHRYIADRQLPDKAVGVLSTACALVSLSQESTPAAIEDARRRLAEIGSESELIERDPSESGVERLTALARERGEIEKLLSELDARWASEREKVAHVNDARRRLDQARQARKESKESLVPEEEASLRVALEERLMELTTVQGSTPLVHDCVTEQSVAEVVSSWTGIPLGRVVRDEHRTVLALRDLLQRRVVGQELALELIAERIRTHKASLENPEKPIGVFLLVGPSGVGKTETALALADVLYGGEKNMISINMSEYTEAHTVAALKGAPPGYVGYGKGGMLSEAVRRQPYSVILLDEFEKAHRDVMRMFYNVFDKGILKDATGREVSFRNTIILCTSNAASRQLCKLCAASETRLPQTALARELEPELTRAFEAPLYGRMLPVFYYPLSSETVRQIVVLQLNRIRERLRENHRALLRYEEVVVEEIAARCTTAEIGARVVDQVLNRVLLPGISNEILAKIAAGQKFTEVHIGLNQNRTFDFSIR